MLLTDSDALCIVQTVYLFPRGVSLHKSFSVAAEQSALYPPTVAANSATGCGNPSYSRRNSAPITSSGAFFMPAA